MHFSESSSCYPRDLTTYLIYLDSRAELSDIRNPINFLRFKIKRGHSWRTLEVEASQLYGAGKNEGRGVHQGSGRLLDRDH